MQTPTLAAALGLLLAFQVAAGSSQDPASPHSAAPVPSTLVPGPKQVATGKQVMVATQLPIVTEAALRVLREGGNAADAAITATFLQHVNDYHQVSVFGAMSGLYYEAATNRYYAFNAFSERPDGSRTGKGDASRVAIGGTVRGLEALAKRFGTRSWSSYIDPAIKSAEEGVLVTSFMYGNNYNLFESSEFQQHREAREFYMPDGHLVAAGHRWKMPELASTLRGIAAGGADYLYTGAWGRKFVAEAERRGGRITLEDMAAYQVRWLEPLRFTYRGHEIVAEPPPNSGGMLVGYNLNLLENFDLAAMGHYSKSPRALEVMARTFGRVEDELRWTIQDPLSFQVPTSIWLSREYGRVGADIVKLTMRQPGVTLAPASSTSTIAELSGDPVPGMPAGQVPGIGSNHNVIADAHGNWITFLHTGHGGAPGVFIDGIRATGSGVTSQSTGPGRRIIAAVTGLFVAKDGRPWLSLGTPGYPPQPLTEVLVNLLDFRMDPRTAADAPRFWSFRGRERIVEIESRIAPEVRLGMKAAGITIKELGDYNWHTGSMQIVWRDAATGELSGVSDPRRLGLAAGF